MTFNIDLKIEFSKNKNKILRNQQKYNKKPEEKTANLGAGG